MYTCRHSEAGDDIWFPSRVRGPDENPHFMRVDTRREQRDTHFNLHVNLHFDLHLNLHLKCHFNLNVNFDLDPNIHLDPSLNLYFYPI